ncbi:MAG TPA: hypothetical protein VF263_26475 [Longimicrobiaceae bacterium]
MRIGDVTVRLVPVGGGTMVEGDDGRVLARPRQVYLVQVSNHSDRRAVAKVSLDGLPVTEGGLVLAPGETMNLERPVRDGEHGRFTVFPEGTEEVFGESGGRDNPDLGLVEVEFRRELARWEPVVLAPPIPVPAPRSPAFPVPGRPAAPPVHPAPSFIPPYASASIREGDVAGAAGTGLTGRSGQTFRVVEVGELEEAATWVRLRIVIGRPEALERARPLPGVRENPVPPRPEPRP